jgi:hypothetical protein
MLPSGVGQLDNEKVVLDKISVIYVQFFSFPQKFGESRACISECHQYVGFPPGWHSENHSLILPSVYRQNAYIVMKNAGTMVRYGEVREYLRGDLLVDLH